MKVLAISTSGPHGGLALFGAGDEVRVAPLAAGRGRGRDVMPALRGLLDDAGLDARDLERLVVDVGPGSFTGVRVGVTVAKTLAWAVGLDEVESTTSLAWLAALAPGAGPVLAVRDAGRGTVYHARYEDGALVTGSFGRAPGPEVARWAEGARVVGEAAVALHARHGWPGEALDLAPGPEELAACVARDDLARCAPHDLAPLYLQASAPERKAAGEVG